MGWSEKVLEPQIGQIFNKLKKKYKVQWVSSTYPQVIIQYEDKISITVARIILGLFPDEVHVEFVPDTKFANDYVPLKEFN